MSLTGLDRRPLYLRLRDEFLDRMRTGEWRPQQVLPNEVQLASAFGVSVGTIRKVMDELSDLGLITRQQGRGTFVKDRGASAEHNMFDPLRNADGSAIKWDPPHLEVSTNPVTPEEATRLGRAGSSCAVLRLAWLRSSGRQILALQQSVVPLDTGIDVERARHAESLNELYGRAGVLVTRIEDRLTVAVPYPDISDRLKVAVNRPLQRISRRFFDADGTVVGICSAWLALQDEYYTCTRTLLQSAMT